MTSYADFIALAQTDPQHMISLARPLVRRMRDLNERDASMDPGNGHRIQQCPKVILEGLDERDALHGADMEALERELRMLLKVERLQVVPAEIDQAEQVLGYMLRPNIAYR